MNESLKTAEEEARFELESKQLRRDVPLGIQVRDLRIWRDIRLFGACLQQKEGLRL